MAARVRLLRWRCVGLDFVLEERRSSLGGGRGNFAGRSGAIIREGRVCKLGENGINIGVIRGHDRWVWLKCSLSVGQFLLFFDISIISGDVKYFLL